jgi:CBS domain-containing protein
MGSSMPNARALRASDVMTPDPRTCSNYSSVLEAIMIFRDADCGIVPVLEDGRPVGVLTDRDVALAVPDYSDLASRPVTEVMTPRVVSVTPDTSIPDVVAKFGEAGVRRLLVMEGDDQLIGIISFEDISRHITENSLGQVLSDIVEQS